MSDESRIAVLADIHGNSWALTAVLDELERRQVNRVINPVRPRSPLDRSEVVPCLRFE